MDEEKRTLNDENERLRRHSMDLELKVDEKACVIDELKNLPKLCQQCR